MYIPASQCPHDNPNWIDRKIIDECVCGQQFDIKPLVFGKDTDLLKNDSLYYLKLEGNRVELARFTNGYFSLVVPLHYGMVVTTQCEWAGPVYVQPPPMELENEAPH